jgi:hypothetical protein
MTERKITKIKTKRGDTETISIAYVVVSDRNEEENLNCSLTSKEEARTEFYDSLDRLRIMLVDAIGLNPKIWLEEGQIIGLSIKYQEEGIGITITGKCEIEGRYACPTTPYLIINDVESDDYQMIQEIMDECCKYLNGERKHFKQQSLFDQENMDYDSL